MGRDWSMPDRIRQTSAKFGPHSAKLGSISSEFVFMPAKLTPAGAAHRALRRRGRPPRSYSGIGWGDRAHASPGFAQESPACPSRSGAARGLRVRYLACIAAIRPRRVVTVLEQAGPPHPQLSTHVVGSPRTLLARRGAKTWARLGGGSLNKWGPSGMPMAPVLSRRLARRRGRSGLRFSGSDVRGPDAIRRIAPGPRKAAPRSKAEPEKVGTSPKSEP